MRKINRRTVLRGMGGISLGLPWLEAMGQSSFSNKNIRLCYLVFPNGVNIDHWTPEGTGSNYKLSKTLAPLEPIKDLVNIHTGLVHRAHSVHAPGYANFLSGVTVKKGMGPYGAGVSCDQIAAQDIGKDSYLPSIELSVEPPKHKGLSPAGYNRAMGAYISWANKTTPVPRELIPINAFDRMFKGIKRSKTTTPEISRSILDYVKEDALGMKRSLGREDSQRIQQYFASVRALERRIQKKHQESFTMPKDSVNPPAGMPKDFESHVELMTDIITLAFQTNRTKVASLMLGNSGSFRRFDFLDGVNGAHHELSHHKGNAQKKKGYEIITRYHVSLFTRMIQKMQAIQEGDKTLLDNSLVLFGSPLWDGDRHTYPQKPILVAGKGGGKVKTGQHIVHRGRTPMNNLLLGMMQTAGCTIKQFNDSTGAVV
ncbi:MAG: DUF1552 domain-containing protein [Lentisphaeraceae bacterium]|nr:DUF1552 domain-containing protein [Lentisphaeraceae bacterium]